MTHFRISAVTPGTQRIAPTRSMSLRERRNLDSSPIPRSQSGNTSQPQPVACWSPSTLQSSQLLLQQQQQQLQQHSHPHVNILHQQQMQQQQMTHHYYSTPSSSNQHLQYQQLQYQNQYGSQDLNISTNSAMMLDTTPHSSMNSSWNSTSHHQSPHTPHYTATQIYMRPRQSIQNSSMKRVPPEVPKRTSSITGPYTPPNRQLRPNGLCKSAENGSLSSVQSSGSDSSASADRIQCELGSDRSNSPQWKRGTKGVIPMTAQSPDHHVTSVLCTSGDATEYQSSHTSAAQYSIDHHEQLNTSNNFKVSETIRKRQYRVGLNLFNKKPERGITYLIRKGFLENTPQGVARFLISRKGLSRQMIGEYLGNLQNTFNMAVLECFAGELDLSGMQVDVALRKFQGYFRMPGEAQKIERLMEIFSQRYCECNTDIIARLRSRDTVRSIILLFNKYITN